MKRVYESLLSLHLSEARQMLFLAGPRQVGKTTVSLTASHLGAVTYFNCDNPEHRRLILAGPSAVAKEADLAVASAKTPILIFDELHKYPRWKSFLKGFFDTHGALCKIIVTGSARLDLFRKGQDSLMGRYFVYRMHPFSVGECARVGHSLSEIEPQRQIKEADFEALWQFGGFPEPFAKRSERFNRRWQALRTQQLFREDIRDLSHIQEIAQLELLAQLLEEGAGQQLNISKLAQRLQAASTTVKRWLETLCNFYHCFIIQPWSQNITRSLIKEPKVYLWDWSVLKEEGARSENFIACHLLKAVHLWTDLGLGEYGLYYLRDKEKREVDFLVARNRKPWFLVEVKCSEKQGLNRALYHFQRATGVLHALQVAIDMPYVDVDCFQYKMPTIVPARTFLSQLV